MLTQEQVEKIERAVKDALETLNSEENEMVYPIQQNVDICRKFLLQEGITSQQLESSFVWQSAFLECRKSGLLVRRPTRAELEAQYHANDRRDGRAKRVGVEPAQHDDPRKVVHDMFQDVFDIVSGKAKPGQPKAEAVEVQWPSLDNDYEQLSAEDQSKYRKLSSDNMRVWLRRRAEVKHRERYGSASGGSVSGDSHIH